MLSGGWGGGGGGGIVSVSVRGWYLVGLILFEGGGERQKRMAYTRGMDEWMDTRYLYRPHMPAPPSRCKVSHVTILACLFALKQAGLRKAPNESPVHVACTPPSPLVTSKAQAKREGPAYPQVTTPSPVTKVTVYEDLRQDIVNTSADAQKFVCAVSKLKEAMEDSGAVLPNQSPSGVNEGEVREGKGRGW